MTHRHNNRTRWAWIALRWGLWGLVGLVATWLVFVATKRGIGTEGDSVTYYMAARTFQDGKGLLQQTNDGEMMPLVQFPPGYPVLLASGATLTGDVLKFAKYLNLIAAFGSVWLSAWITHRFTRSLLISLVVAIWFGTHGHFIAVHARMFSEPTYILLTLMIVAILIRHGPRGNALWIAGILAGIATLVRFAGLYMIGTCVLWVLLSNLRHGWGKSLTRAILFATPAGAFVGGWMLRNKLVSDAATSRIARFHPPPMKWITDGLDYFKWWVIPVEKKTIQNLVYPWPAMAVWGAGIGMWLWRGRCVASSHGVSRAPEPKLEGSVPSVVWRIAQAIVKWVGAGRYWFSGRSGRLALPAMLLIFYFPFLLTARTFMDEAIPSNNRMLSPVLVFSLIVAWSWLYRRWKWLRRQYQFPSYGVYAAVMVLVAWLMVLEFRAGRDLSNKLAKLGIGYQAPAWRNSPTIELIKSLPADVPIFTNAADVVYLMTDRVVSTVPRSRKQPDGSYRVRNNESTEVVNAIRQEQALVVYFKSIKRDSLLASKDLLKQRTGLVEVYSFRDAVVLGIDKQPLPKYLPTTRPTSKPAPDPDPEPAADPE